MYYYFIIVEERPDNNGVVDNKYYDVIEVEANSLNLAKKGAGEIVACANAGGWHHWRLKRRAYSSAEAARSAIKE